MTGLSDDELERYARHIVLQDVGGAGQARLKAARVLVVGAGGLGAPVLQYLAAAGVGTLGIVDDDRVDLSNLQRQVIHTSADIGRAKVDSAADALARINPHVSVIRHQQRLDGDNAAALIAAYDIVADGSDSFATRFAVNATCVALARPLVSAAVGPFDGQLSTFKGYLADQPCYRCFVPQLPGGEARSCADAGVIGALTGVVGSLQALEVIRQIVGFGTAMDGRLLLFDGRDNSQRIVRLRKDPACLCCGAGR